MPPAQQFIAKCRSRVFLYSCHPIFSFAANLRFDPQPLFGVKHGIGIKALSTALMSMRLMTADEAETGMVTPHEIEKLIRTINGLL